MTNRIVWQFEGQDKSVASTIGEIDNAIQKMATGDKTAFSELQTAMSEIAPAFSQVESAVNTLNQRYQQSYNDIVKYRSQIKDLKADLASMQIIGPPSAKTASTIDETIAKIRELTNETKLAAKPFADLGITVVGNFGRMKDLDTIFGQVITKLREADPTAQRTAQAINLLGTSGSGLVTQSGKIYEALTKLESAYKNSQQAALNLAKDENNASNASNNLATNLNKTEKASISFFDRVKAYATGNILANFFMNLTNDVVRTGEELLKQTFTIQQYGETYVHILGSSAAAKERFKEIFSFATDVPQTIPQILALDQMLTTMAPNADAIKSKLGVSFAEMRQIIVDASSALNKNVEDVGGAIRRLYDGASGYGINSLRRMGMISNDELIQQGVQFKAGTNTILSNSDVTLSAVLKIWQQKYGGMAEVQSNTLGGILNNMKDFALNAFRELAGPSLDVAQQKLKQLWEALKSPETLNQLAIAGDRLGKIADLAFRAFDIIGRGAAAAINFVRPLTDEIGKLLDMMSGGGSGDNFYFNQDAAKAFNANLGDQNTQITDNSDAIANLNDQLDASREKQQNINDAYAGATNALQDQLSLLERMHQIHQQDDEMAKLSVQITRDKALAVDHYNKTGQDAALRLVDENAKMKELQETKQYDAKKNSIEDQIKSIERAKQTALAANAAEEHSIEQTIKALQKQDQQQQYNLNNLFSNTNKTTASVKTENLHLLAQPNLFDQIGAAIQRVTGPLSNYSAIWTTLSQTWINLPGQIQAFTDKISGANDKTNSLALIGGFLDYQFKSFFTYIQDEGSGILSGFGSGVNLVTTLISTMIQGLMSGFRELANMTQNPTDPSKWQQGVVSSDDLRNQLSNAWNNFNNQMANPDITGVDRYNRDQARLDEAWQQQLRFLTTAPPPSISDQYGNYQGSPGYDNPSPSGKSGNIRFSSGSNILTANIVQQCPTCLAKAVIGQVTANPGPLANAIAANLVSSRRF